MNDRSARDGLIALERDESAYAAFSRELPRMSRDWFDDAIQLEPWEHVPTGYIQTSPFYGRSADEAHRRGWPVARYPGTHLHPALQPAETASAIATLCRRFNC